MKWMAAAAEAAGEDQPVRTPNFDIVCGWIAAAWKAISKEIIIRSFQCCGLTTALDGSEDISLHCFKIPELHDGLLQLVNARVPHDILNPQVDAVVDPEPIDAQSDDELLDDDVIVQDMNDLELGAHEEL